MGSRRLSRIPGGKRSSLSGFATDDRLTQPSHAARGRGSEALVHHSLHLRTLRLVWRCRIAVRVVPHREGTAPVPCSYYLHHANALYYCRSGRIALHKVPFASTADQLGWHAYSLNAALRRGQQTMELYSPRYTAPIQGQTRNRRLIYTLHTSQGFCLFSSSQCF